MSNEASEHGGGRKGSQSSMSRTAMIAGAVVVALGVAYVLFGRGGEDIAPGTTFIAKRGDLDITVSEGGSIEALESQEIRSHIKGHNGVKILTLIDEGYLVTEEDVENGLILVVLDSADLVDRRVNQEISVQSAQAQFIEKRAQFDIQMSNSQSTITAAELLAKFALMDFEKFLGKKAVDLIVGELGLVDKAAELKAMKASGLVIAALPEIAPAVGLSMAEDFGPAQEWGRGGSGRGDFSERRGPPEGMRRGGGGDGPSKGGPQMEGRRGGAGGGFGGAGGRMDPDSFKKMIEANGGKLPQAMEDRMREMGMDPNTILERMGIASSGDVVEPEVSQELELGASDIETKPVFTNQPAYIAAREAIDFASYANVDELEDGEAKKMLRQLQDESLLEKEASGLAKTELKSYERLAEKGHITQIELDNERLTAQRQQIREELAAMSESLYIQYTLKRDAEQFLSDYEEALMSLERTIHEAGAQLAQADVGFKSAERKYGLEVHQLDDLKEQIRMCVIRAERTGLVVYGSSSETKGWRGGSDEPTQEGKTVRQREKIITIPDMTKMGVTVDIQESDVQKVAKGQRVTMTIDAYRERTLTGSVERVAVLADSGNMFMNPDMKVYPTMVRIDGVHDWLRPGMTANVEVLIETLSDVVYIPIQAVSYFGDAQVCYVVNDGKSERRFIEVGSFTENFIEVRSGLEAGEEVRLLPPGAGEQDKMKLQEGVDAAEPKSPEKASIT